MKRTWFQRMLISALKLYLMEWLEKEGLSFLDKLRRTIEDWIDRADWIEEKAKRELKARLVLFETYIKRELRKAIEGME